MLNLALLITAKDLRILFSGPGPILQGLLLGLLIIFIFSLSKPAGEIVTAAEAATIFWLASLFYQLLAFNQLYGIEEANSSRQALLMLPGPVQGIWLGKALGGLLLIICGQLLFLPGMIVFLGQNIRGPVWPGAAALAISDLGMACAGSLLGAVAQGQTARESLLGIILFPLLAPLLLSAISLGSVTLSGLESADAKSWLELGLGFDAIFMGCGLALFGFLYQGSGQ